MKAMAPEDIKAVGTARDAELAERVQAWKDKSAPTSSSPSIRANGASTGAVPASGCEVSSIPRRPFAVGARPSHGMRVVCKTMHQ